MASKNSLLTITVLLVAAWFVCSALNRGETTYVIKATFDGIYGNPAGASVFITQERGVVSDFSRSDRYHSCLLGKGGVLNTEFSGVPNRETYIYIIKDGFVPARYSFMLRDPEEDQEMGDVALVSYPKGKKAAEANAEVPCNGQIADNSKLLQVQYLENFRPVNDFHCEDNSHTIVFEGHLIQSGQPVYDRDFSILYPPNQRFGLVRQTTGNGK